MAMALCNIDLSKSWTLDEALELIRSIQPIVMDCGYYIALAGGVLNNGMSKNDLDLVAVPRPFTGSNTDLLRYFGRIFKQIKEPSIKHRLDVYIYEYEDRRIDIAIIRI